MGKLLLEAQEVCSRELSIYNYMYMCPHVLDSKMTQKLETTVSADLPDPVEASLPGMLTRGRATARDTRGM